MVASTKTMVKPRVNNPTAPATAHWRLVTTVPPRRVINTDKAPSLARAIAELKSEGICPPTVEHRQVKYLNNILEGDHGRLKRILGPKGTFKNRTSAYRTLKGMEAMHLLRKGQGTMFAYGQPNPDAVNVNRVFETA